MARTVSVPQRSGTLSDPLLYETLSRMIAAINSALTVAMAPSIPTSPSGTITPTNPVTRLVGGGTIRTIGVVDFDVPIYLIASTSDVELETGGNIGAAVTIKAGTACALVQDKTVGVWWPITGGGGTDGFTGSVTTNAIPMATGPLVLGDSPLYKDANGIAFDGYAPAPRLTGRRAKGTVGSPAALGNGDAIFEVGGVGRGATAFAANPGAYLSMNATEDWTDSVQGASFVLWATPNGSTVPSPVLDVRGDGNIWLANGLLLGQGNGSPEGAVAAPVGSTYRRRNGGAGTTFYVKESGTGSTGWAAK